MATPSFKPCESQQRILQIIEVLANDVVHGYTNAQIAKTINAPPPYVTRDLQNLIARNWVVFNPELERYTLGSVIATIAVKALKTIDAAEEKLSHLKKRFTN